MLQPIITFSLLMATWTFTRLFYRIEDDWIGDIPARQWGHLRAIIIVNHTSLYEPLLAGIADWRLLWLFARHGLFFKLMVRHTVVVTRQRDHTWNRVLNSVDDRSIVIILPEGRMKRRDGLDSQGRPMTIKGGIADILEPIEKGRILLLYSGGFHHIQAPGERYFPKLFKTIRARLEIIELDRYKREVMANADGEEFREALIKDLTRRRDLHCPGLEDPSLK